MKKTLIIPLILFSFLVNAQTIDTLLGYRGNLIKDTAIAVSGNYLFTPTHTSISFDSSRVITSVTKNATNDSFQFRNGSGAIVVKLKDSSGGGSSGDTLLKIITGNNLGNNGSTSNSNYLSGLILRNLTTSPTIQNTPVLMFEGYRVSQFYYRIFGDATLTPGKLRFQYSSDSITWNTGVTFDNLGNIGCGGITATGNVNILGATFGSKFYLLNDGSMSFGVARKSNPRALIEMSTDTSRGFLNTRVTTDQKELITGNVYRGVVTTGGSGYVSGPVSFTGGSGRDLTANITASGGAVTSVSAFAGGKRYKDGDVLTINAASGSGAQFTVTAIQGDTAKGLQIVDTVINRPEYYNGQYWVGSGGLLTVTTTASSYAITNEDVLFVNSSGTATVTLPSADHANRVIWIRNLSATNTVTIVGMATGENTSIATKGGMKVTSDGTGFYELK